MKLLRQTNDPSKDIQNRIKIWPVQNSNPKKPLKSEKPEHQIPQLTLPSLKTNPEIFPKSSSPPCYTVDQIFSDKPLSFPSISTLCKKIKEMGVKSQSSRFLDCINENDEIHKKPIKPADINEFIKKCEQEKNLKVKRPSAELENLQGEMSQILGLVQKFTKQPKPVVQKRKRENDCYFTRVQIRKLLAELRACTKHIN